MATGLDYLLNGDAQAPTSGLDYLLSGAPPPKPTLAPKEKPQEPPKPAPAFSDVLRNGIWKGVAGFGDMAGNTLVNLANLGIAGYGVAKHEITGSNDLPEPIPADTLSGFQKLFRAGNLINDKAEPTTGAGRVVDFTGQVLGGGGINPRAAVTALAKGKVAPLVRDLTTPTVGGVAGGLAAEGVRDNVDPNAWWAPAANAVIPMAAQMGAGYPTARMSSAGTRAAQTTKNVTPQQWEQAQALGAKAAAMGAPITAAEALQQVTGTNPGLQSLQRVTEQSTPGVNMIAPEMAKRPGQNAAVLKRVADGISGPELDPGGIAGTLNLAAKGAIENARKQGNTLAAPFYARSSNDPNVLIPPADWAKITADPGVAWALDRVKRDPLSGVQNAPPGSLQWLDAAKKFLGDAGDSASVKGENFRAKNANAAANAITAGVDPLVPDYATARSIIAANMKNNVEPMQAGQIGKLSETNDFVKQAQTLLPEKPMDVTPPVLDKTAKTLAQQDPAILKRFVAQYLRGTFNESNQGLQGGGNQWGGANFAAKVAGNDLQGQNLRGLLDSVGADPSGLNDALSVFQAQGTRPHTGSATTFNNGETGLLSGGLLSSVGKPLQLPGMLAEKASYSLATKELANALLPDGMSVQRFQELARANGAYSPAQQAAFAALLKASTNAQSQGSRP